MKSFDNVKSNMSSNTNKNKEVDVSKISSNKNTKSKNSNSKKNDTETLEVKNNKSKNTEVKNIKKNTKKSNKKNTKDGKKENVLDKITNFLEDAEDKVTGAFKSAGKTITKAAGDAIELAEDTYEKASSFISEGVSSAVENVKKFAKDTKEDIEKTTKAIVGECSSALSKAGDWIDKNIISTGKDVLNTAVKHLKKTGASIVNETISLSQGLLNFGESVLDLGVIAGTGVLSVATGAVDLGQFVYGKATGAEWHSATKAMWKGAKEFVKVEGVNEAYKMLYETEPMKALDNEAYSWARHDGIGYKIGEGIGEVGGIILADMATAGLFEASGGGAISTLITKFPKIAKATKAVGSSSIIAGLSGFAKSTAAAWNEGKSTLSGLGKGAINGLWDMSQWAVGKAVQGSTFSKITGKITNETAKKLTQSGMRAGLDSVTAAAETPFGTIKDAIFDHKDIKTAWEDNGGSKGMGKQAAVGFISSIVGEAFDLGRSSRKQTKSNVDVNIKNSTEAVDAKKITSQNKTISNDIDLTHGFQLNESDLGEFFQAKIKQGFFTKEQVENFFKINQKGYMDAETGNALKNLFSGENNVFVKTIHSSDADSIMTEGIRCLGTSTSTGIGVNSIKDINLNNTVTDVTTGGMYELTSILKNSNGLSQGMNPIDGAMVLKVPKGLSLEDILIYNENSGTYNIDPKYNVGFIGCDANGNLSKIKTGSTVTGRKLDLDTFAKRYDMNPTDEYVKSLYSSFEEVVNNENVPADLKKILQNIDKFSDEVGMGIMIADTGSKFLPGGNVLYMNENFFKKGVDPNMTFQHELGHALYYYGKNQGFINPTDLTIEIPSVLQSARGNIDSNKNLFYDVLKSSTSDYRNSCKEAANWYSKIRDSEAQKMRDLVSDLFKSGDADELEDILRQGFSVEKEHGISQVTKLIEEAGLNNEDISEILNNRELMTEIAIKQNALSKQYNYIESLNQNYSKYGDGRKKSSMLNSVTQNKNPIKLDDGTIIGYSAAHGNDYWVKNLNQWSADELSYDELFADFVSLKNNGRVETLKEIKSVIGDDLYNSLESNYNKIIAGFAKILGG